MRACVIKRVRPILYGAPCTLGVQNVSSLKSLIKGHRIHQLGSLAESTWIRPIWLSRPDGRFDDFNPRISNEMYFETLMYLYSFTQRRPC